MVAHCIVHASIIEVHGSTSSIQSQGIQSKRMHPIDMRGCRIHKSQVAGVNVSDRVAPAVTLSCAHGPWQSTIGDGILAHPPGARDRSSANTLPSSRPWPGGRGASHVKLLLMSEEQISPRKTSRTLGTLKRLLFRMRALVPFQMLEPGE